jgi:hypothetical protein
MFYVYTYHFIIEIACLHCLDPIKNVLIPGFIICALFAFQFKSPEKCERQNILNFV